MRKILFLILVLQLQVIKAQNQEIKTNLPIIIPPSPTVAALMKFEEIPVSNYTGIPDITIPLFISATHSKDINLDIALKYHPASIGVDEKSSDVGLGWSLFAGGTISRTVKSLPDEIFEGVNARDNGKVGIYQTPENGKTNNFYNLTNLIENNIQFNNSQLELKKEYLYEAHEKGKYDIEHDLWQFNFMGKTGKFIIKKNILTGVLEIEKLSDNNLKIVNQYGSPLNPYEPLSFIIYDDKGYKYFFNVIENTESNNFTDNWFLSVNTSNNFSKMLRFKSAFHITKILDSNNNLLIDFLYDNRITKEMNINGTGKYSIPKFDTHYMLNQNGDNSPNCVKFLEPTTSNNGSFKRVYTKKLIAIDVVGVSKINFNFIMGRDDSKIHRPDSVFVLKSIEIKDWGNKKIKKFNFEHQYSDLNITKRLILNKLKIYDKEDIKFTNYEFYYYDQFNFGTSLTKDYWGYFTENLFCKTDSEYREPSKKFSTLDLLRKIKYPTGGSVVFDFEPNQYSYVGNFPAEDFEIENNFNTNSENSYVSQTVNYHFGGQNQNSVILPPVTSKQLIKISTSLTFDESQNYKFLVLQKNNVFFKGFSCTPSCDGCEIQIYLEPGNQYKLVYTLADNLYLNDIEDVQLKFLNFLTGNSYYKNFIGGGNRIKRISYFSKEVNHFFNETLSRFETTDLPEKEKNFSYNFFNETNRSSGSLAYYKPIYNYPFSKRACIECNGFIDDFVYDYDVSTSYNNLQSRKTQGADIGYKNVSIFETNLGKINYIYTSPIDFSNLDSSFLHFPFIDLSPDLDYLCGQNISEKIYNQNENIVTESTNIFQTDIFEKNIGFDLNFKYGNINSNSISYRWKTYADYKTYLFKCGQKINQPGYTGPPNFVWGFVYHMSLSPLYYPCFCYVGEPDEFISIYLKNEAFGWAKLTSKSTKNYFYPNNGINANIVETNESFTYNPINKKIATSTVTTSTGDILKTNYTYDTANSLFSQNRISEIKKIESFRNDILLTKNEINYSSTFLNNTNLLPQSITSKKEIGLEEVKVKFNRYNEYGNVLELQQESGIIITYIYGYNKTLPIAKIENATYAQVQQYEANIQSLSNGTNEGVLIQALNNLRTQLPNAMVTTYTHKPLIGVSTITDPKGDTITYTYDSFGRLQYVTDKNGNKLSENQYNYKP